MKLPIFLILSLFLVQKSNAQNSLKGHTITCINFIDEKGNALNTVSVNEDREEVIEGNPLVLESFPDLSNMQNRNKNYFDDLTETLENDEETGQPQIYYYAGRPSVHHLPFKKDYYYFSGPVREFTAVRVTGGQYDTMRIILINNNAKTDSGFITTYLINDVVFKTGTYDIDCNKIKNKKDAAYEGKLSLRLFTVKAKPRARTKIKIPAKAFSDYNFFEYRFFQDSLFKYSGHNEEGNGVYKFTPSSLELFFKNVPGRVQIITEKKPENINQDTSFTFIKCRLQDAKNEMELPYATVLIKGTNTGTYTDNNGLATLKVKKSKFPITLVASFVGYSTTEIRLHQPAAYEVKIFLDYGIRHIDSGVVKKGVFTDFTDDFIGIYWLLEGETFSFNNQYQMAERQFYYHKRIRRAPIVYPD